MSNKILCVLVNCNRVLEGTLRNVLPGLYTIQTATIKNMENCLFMDGGLNKQPLPVVAISQPIKKTGLDAARSSIAALLERDASLQKVQKVADGIENEDGTIASTSINPDCIIYQINDNSEYDIDAIRMMRRKCRFRDIPIIIVTVFSEMPRANILVQHGANAIVVFPTKPEMLLKTIAAAMEPAGSRMPVITKVINPYISATVDLLITMAGMHAEKKEVFLKKNYRLFGDISAIMSFTGEVEGEVVVCFEEKLARDVVSRIMTTQPEALTKDELKEGIGEVVNIIAGNAKATLANSEYTHRIGLPTVVLGQGHELSHPSNAPCIVVVFDVEGQPMAVLVSMSVKGK